MIDRPAGHHLTLPVQRVNGQWEFVYGGDIPVRNGCYADLVVHQSAITDRKFRDLVNQKIVIPVLDEGTPLHVALSDKTGQFRNATGRHEIRVARQYWPGNSCGYAPIWLGPSGARTPDQERGGLWMHHTGLDRCELVSSLIRLPDGMDEFALSLNHAFTLLSERYETHRMSHTGNVYERVFYEESDGQWYPLSHLRDGVRERAHRKVVSQAWAQIEEQLGWCRLPKDRKQRNGGGTADER